MQTAMIDNEWQEQNPLTVKRWLDYGFDLDDIDRYGLRDIKASEAAAMGFSRPYDGIYIPYPNDKDSRIRYYPTGFGAQLEDTAKYGQRPGTPPAAFWPGGVGHTWLEDRDVPVLITEGEFKAIAVDYLVNSPMRHPAVVPIGLGGVSSWMSRKLGLDMLPELAAVKWAGRRVWVAFDADLATNPSVALALSKLFNKLVELGAQCRVLSWDAERGKGIDDYLTQSSIPRMAYEELVAKAQVPSHVLGVVELNKRFCYVEREQKVWDAQSSGWIKVNSFSGEFFTERLKVQVGVKKGPDGTAPVLKDMTLGAYWLQSPARNAVNGLQFEPGCGQYIEVPSEFGNRPVRFLNTWKGWGCDLRGKLLKPERGDVSPFLEFVRAAFGHEAPEHAEYLLRRLAWMFQQPTSKHPTWVYLIGAPYQGKSTLLKIIASLVGQAYTTNIDEKILAGSFDAWRADKLLVTLDDSSMRDKYTIKQLLKRLTTEEFSQINKKHQNEYTTPSYFTFFFAANGIDPLLEHDDRRALVLSAECPWDFAAGEWKPFDDWRRKPESLAALLHYFLYEVKLDASFLTEQPPHTMARAAVIEAGNSGWDEFLLLLSDAMGQVAWAAPASGEVRRWMPTIFTPHMLRVIYSTMYTDDKYQIKNGALGAKISRFGGAKAVPKDSTDPRGRVMVDGMQQNFYTFSRAWMNRLNEEMVQEYKSIVTQFPELRETKVKTKY